MFGKRGLLAFLTASLLGPDLAPARAEPQATDANAAAVSGTGTVVLKRRPDRMRVRVDVFARGRTLEEALATLKDRREAITLQLTTLGASKDSIAFEPPRVNTSLLEARKQMEAMIRARSGVPPAKEPKKEPTGPSVVTTVLTAEWPVKGESVEDALIEAARLQDAVKEADLAGMKEVEKPSTDDEEIGEELAGMPMDPNQAGQPRPGTPTFLFVGTIPPAERSKAMADAYRKARDQAESTARAAGASLGALRRLESDALSSAELENADMTNPANYRLMQPGGGIPAEVTEDESEVRGSQPGLVSCRIKVVASFSLR